MTLHHTPKLAFLGIGLMGRPMALRLLAGGYPLVVWNRDAKKTQQLESAGATVADTPEQALRGCDGVVFMFSVVAAIRDTILTDPAQQALAGRAVLQMGTSLPLDSVDIIRYVTRCVGRYLEASVLGSISEALR